MWKNMRILILLLSPIAGYISTLYVDQYPIFFHQREGEWGVPMILFLLLFMLVGPFIMAYGYKIRLQKGLFMKPLDLPIWHSNFITSNNPLPSFHICSLASIGAGLTRIAVLYSQGQKGWDAGHLLVLAGLSILAFVYLSLFWSK